MFPIILALALCAALVYIAVERTPKSKPMQSVLVLSPIALGMGLEQIGLAGEATSWGPGPGTLILFGLFALLIVVFMIVAVVQNL